MQIQIQIQIQEQKSNRVLLEKRTSMKKSKKEDGIVSMDCEVKVKEEKTEGYRSVRK